MSPKLYLSFLIFLLGLELSAQEDSTFNTEINSDHKVKNPGTDVIDKINNPKKKENQ